MVLEAFQKKVAAEAPLPPGAVDIPDEANQIVDRIRAAVTGTSNG